MLRYQAYRFDWGTDTNAQKSFIWCFAVSQILTGIYTVTSFHQSEQLELICAVESHEASNEMSNENTCQSKRAPQNYWNPSAKK